MKVSKLEDGDIELTVNLDELETIGQCMNEVCHGFVVRDFTSRIGADKPYVVSLLDQIVAMYPSLMYPSVEDSSPPAEVTSMTIEKTGADEYRVTMTPAEARICINCMKETFREGPREGIRASEYQTRVGVTIDAVKGVVSAIEAALSS
jgi:hypothetical protein